MFTGIITHTGRVTTASRSGISVRAPRALAARLARGGSVAVDGVCLTVVSRTADSFSADVMPETARKTTLGTLERGIEVNLELPATPKTFLSGHIVQGHVDGIGTIRRVRADGASLILSVAVPRTLVRYLAPKGSVAVNGVSLTVVDATASGFTVGIIPHTREATGFRSLKQDDLVNVEVDVIARYAERFICRRRADFRNS